MNWKLVSLSMIGVKLQGIECGGRYEGSRTLVGKVVLLDREWGGEVKKEKERLRKLRERIVCRFDLRLQRGGIRGIRERIRVNERVLGSWWEVRGSGWQRGK